METKIRKTNINLVKAVKGVMGVVSVLRILIPSFDMLYKEEKMHFLSAFDLLLLFWIPVLNIFGQWLKKKKLPCWCPPTPIMIILASFLICGVSGALRIHAEGSELYAQVVWYSLANGCLISLFSMGLYDIVTGFLKTQWLAIKDLWARIIAKRKEGKK